MSARSRYLLQRDLSREETTLGKKAREAGAYLEKEKSIATAGGTLGALAGGAWAAPLIQGALFGAGPVGWVAAAIGTGLGYMAGAKLGEETAEAIHEKKIVHIGEDEYSKEDGEFYQEMREGKFLKESKTETIDSLMEAKKGADIWTKGEGIGGIGKEALLAAATAGVKTRYLDKVNYKGEGIKPDSKAIIDESINKAITVPDVPTTSPTEITEKVIASEYPGYEGLSMPDPPKLGGNTLMSQTGTDLASAVDKPTGGIVTASDINQPGAVRSRSGAHRVGKGADKVIKVPEIAEVPETAKPDWDWIDAEQQKNIAAEAERVALASRGTESVGENLEQVIGTSDVDMNVLDPHSAAGTGGYKPSPSKKKTAMQVLREQNMEYKGKLLEPEAPLNIGGQQYTDLPTPYSPEELENIKHFDKPGIDWDEINAEQQKNILAEKNRMIKMKDTSAFGMEDFTEESYEKTINQPKVDYTEGNKTLNQLVTSPKDLTQAQDVKVTAATAEQTQNMYDMAIKDFYKQGKTAKETYDMPGVAEGFENLPFYENLPGAKKINKYFNWHKKINAAFQ